MDNVDSMLRGVSVISAKKSWFHALSLDNGQRY